MTKRDRQAREYALDAESYEKGDEIRTNTTTDRDTTPAVGSVQRDLIERLRRWCHDVYAQSAQDIMEEAADEIERLRRDARYWRAMHEHNCPEPQWMDRSQVSPSDPNRQCLLYTDKLEGFIWIGRKGVLPADVSHWIYLPEPPSAGRPSPPEAAKIHPAGS